MCEAFLFQPLERVHFAFLSELTVIKVAVAKVLLGLQLFLRFPRVVSGMPQTPVGNFQGSCVFHLHRNSRGWRSQYELTFSETVLPIIVFVYV